MYVYFVDTVQVFMLTQWVTGPLPQAPDLGLLSLLAIEAWQWQGKEKQTGNQHVLLMCDPGPMQSLQKVHLGGGFLQSGQRPPWTPPETPELFVFSSPISLPSHKR